MIQKDFLQEIIRQQKEMLQIKEKGMLRNELKTLPDIDNYALIVSGVRRCGKSTLLHQLLKQKQKLYILTLTIHDYMILKYLIFRSWI